MDRRGRVGRIEARLVTEGLDALYVTKLPNVRYLSGFTGSNASMLIGRTGVRFFTDGRYRAQSAEEVEGAEIDVYGLPDQMESSIRRAARELEASRIGFESDHVSVSLAEKLRRSFEQRQLVPTTGWVERLRRVKDPEELSLIRTAARMADEGLGFILDEVKPGKSERELALELEFHMRRLGADDVSFDPIVAAAERSALPHANPTNRQVESGRYLLFDLGCIHAGYCSDLTRTVLVGAADDRHREIYELVARAQQAGLEAVRAGRRAAEVDRAARQVIDDAGLSEAFGHGLGHGVGIEVHEDPTLRATSEDVLEPGQVVTIEPGAYFPGWGGVRIEDLVVVTEEGAEVLSAAPKDLMIL